MYRKQIASLYQLFSLLFLLFSFDANSQFQPSTPFREDSLVAATWLKATSLRLEEDKAGLSGENKKYVAAQFQERFDQLKSMYEQQTFITDIEACTYLHNLLQRIVAKNAVLTPLKPRVLFSKVYWPNASSFGEGSIVFNTDYERSKDYKGKTFHSLSYHAGSITSDKINLASKASSMRIMPGKTGFIMVSEYFRKDKKMELRLEKIN